MNVSLAACRIRTTRYASCRSAFLPVRSVTCLQRSRPLLHASPILWTPGLSRSFSWNSFGVVPKSDVLASKPAPEAPVSQSSSVAEENVGAAAVPPSQPSGESLFTPSDLSAPVDASVTETLSDSIADAATTLATSPAPMSYGDMAALGIVSWTPAGLAIWLLEFGHVSTGLPWWSTIILMTIGARMALVPLVIKNTRMQALLAPIQPQVKVLRDRSSKLMRAGDTFGAKQAQMQMTAVMSKAGVNQVESIVAMVGQVAVQLGFFLGLRRMCNTPVEQLQTGGFGWITDLTAVDPLYILPFTNFVLVNLQMAISKRDMLAAGSSMFVFNCLRVFSLFAGYITLSFSAGLNLHLITSIAFIALQTLTLRLPVVRRALKLGPLPPVPPVKGQSLKESLTSVKGAVKKVKDWWRQKMEDQARKEAETQRKIRMAQKPPPRNY